MSIRPGWFYHTKEDDRVKSPRRLLDIYFSSVGCNSLLLLNIPPDKRGLLADAEYFNGSQWKPLTAGTTVGYKRLLRFEPITTQKIRLHILSSRLNPTLSELGLYKLAQ